jgi:hypothetical protein
MLSIRPTLQRHNTENSKQIFSEKELRGLSPNFHIHVSVGDLLQENLEYINRSQAHECGNWDSGRAIPFLGIHKWDFFAVHPVEL